MKSLSDYEGRTLVFIQPKLFKSVFELRDGEDEIASLKLEGLFGTRAKTQGELFGKWEFYKPSFWKNKLDVREQGKELPIAHYHPKFFKQTGTLELPRGARLKIVSKVWKAKIEIQTESGEALVIFSKKVALKDKAEVVILKVNETLNKYPWVVLLTGHILQMQRRNHAAHAG